MKAFAYLVFPNSILSVLPEGSSLVQGEPMEHGIITSVTHGAMSGNLSTLRVSVSHLWFLWHAFWSCLWGSIYDFKSLILLEIRVAIGCNVLFSLVCDICLHISHSQETYYFSPSNKVTACTRAFTNTPCMIVVNDLIDMVYA